MIKGGVWKNTEDEILKAAVMKYGKHQWARVSSLLVRKSAKQCKARWYEWLGPSIKKTEWTREEEEKLLHLAKLMPTQWRTIAPIVGRTPAQCLERYEKLLDQATERDDAYDAKDDPRRLRPGEIDPNPEAKPARPDPQDMDEDEKEMLNEARARLANTKGKKAKRKAREKQLEEAKRLANLQKRRELKAAGIEHKHRRKVVGIDYNEEIAFQRKPPPGFYDTTAEDADMTRRKADARFKPVSLQDMEGKRRKDIERELIRKDKAKEEMQKRKDRPGYLKKIMEMNDKGPKVSRGRMALPAPQVSDAELGEIARLNTGDGGRAELEAGAGGRATQGLIADRSQTPLRTPVRTPMRMPAPGGGAADPLLAEAANLARLQANQTPLLGGESVDVGSDFSGILPDRKAMATPSALSLPGPSTSDAPAPSRAPGLVPAPTPSQIVIDEPGGDAALPEPQRPGKLSFSSLPAPKNEYQIVIPELPAAAADAEMQLDEDMEDILAQQAKGKAEKEEARKRKRSQVVQRELPRLVPGQCAVDAPPGPDGPPEAQARALLQAEVRLMAEHDAQWHPVKAKKAPKRTAKSIEDDFFPVELEEARDLIAAEGAALVREKGLEGVAEETLVAYLAEQEADLIYCPQREAHVRPAALAEAELLAALKAEFARVLEAMKKEAKRASKLEEKVNVVTAGLLARNGEFRGQLAAASAALEKKGEQLQAFRMLQSFELLAGPARKEALEQEVAGLKEREAALQARYKGLTERWERLQAAGQS